SLDRVVVVRALDVVAHRVDGDVLAKIVSRDLHHAMIGAAPRACRRAIAAGYHHAPGAGQDVVGAKSLGNAVMERLRRRDADHAGARRQANGLDRLFEGRALCGRGHVRSICGEPNARKVGRGCLDTTETRTLESPATGMSSPASRLT